MAGKYDTNFTGLSRTDVIGLRARLISDPEFGKALLAGDAEARLANQAISEFLVANGGGQLSTAEMKLTGYEATEPHS